MQWGIKQKWWTGKCMAKTKSRAEQCRNVGLWLWTVIVIPLFTSVIFLLIIDVMRCTCQYFI